MKVRLKMDTALARAIVQNGGAQGVRQAAQMILTESQKQVPLDTGALLRSGTVEADGLQATISYDTPYAARWHEQQANFQRGRKRKYLEDPVNDPSVRRRMLEYFQRNIKL